jgi:hypothetical protein
VAEVQLRVVVQRAILNPFVSVRDAHLTKSRKTIHPRLGMLGILAKPSRTKHDNALRYFLGNSLRTINRVPSASACLTIAAARNSVLAAWVESSPSSRQASPATHPTIIFPCSRGSVVRRGRQARLVASKPPSRAPGPAAKNSIDATILRK